MSVAIDLSREMMEDDQGGPFGAVITKDGKVVAKGWNKVTSANDPTAHAEMTAIRNACEELGTHDLTGYDIYTSCEPCPMCLSAIYWAHLGNIYYANTRNDAAEIGFDDEFLYREVAAPLNQRSKPTVYLNMPEARKVFDEWYAKENKIQY